jgi:hypothetical protein
MMSAPPKKLSIKWLSHIPNLGLPSPHLHFVILLNNTEFTAIVATVGSAFSSPHAEQAVFVDPF